MTAPVVAAFTSTDSGGTGVTELTLTQPSGVSTGDLLVLICANDASNTADWNTLTGWTRFINANTVVADAAIGCYWRVADGTEGTSVTPTSISSSEAVGWYLRVTGADTSTPINVVGSLRAMRSTTHTGDPITTTVDDCLAFYVIAFDGGDGAPFSVASPWSESDEGASGRLAGVGAAWGTLVVATAGSSGSPEITSSTSDGASVMTFAIAPAGTEDNLTADDVESASEVSTPAIGQKHSLTAASVESDAELSSPALSEVTPAVDLFAEDAESTSEVSAPVFGQIHVFAAIDIDAPSEVSMPALGQIHALGAGDAESVSEVSSPSIGQAHSLNAGSVQSSAEVGLPSIGQKHALSASAVESGSEISTPSLTAVGGVAYLLADDVESLCEVSLPLLGQLHVLQARSVESGVSISIPVAHMLGFVDVDGVSTAWASQSYQSTSWTPQSASSDAWTDETDESSNWTDTTDQVSNWN